MGDEGEELKGGWAAPKASNITFNTPHDLSRFRNDEEEFQEEDVQYAKYNAKKTRRGGTRKGRRR